MIMCSTKTASRPTSLGTRMTYTGERRAYQSILCEYSIPPSFWQSICFASFAIYVLLQRAHRFRKSREVPGGLSGGSSLRRIYVSSILNLMQKSTCLHPIFSQLDRWKLWRGISRLCALLQPWRGDILSKLYLRSSIMSGSMMCASDNNNGVSSKLEHWCNTTKRTSGVQMRRAWGMRGDRRERPRCGKFCPSSQPRLNPLQLFRWLTLQVKKNVRVFARAPTNALSIHSWVNLTHSGN